MSPPPPSPPSSRPRRFRARSRIGKYRIESLLAEGNYSNVYRAFDTIEGLRVALKIPHPHLADDEFVEGFRHEARLAAKIQSPRLLSLKDASVIDGHFVLAYPLGEESLADRLTRRVSTQNLALITEHCLEGVALLHQERIIHCDIKPENFILFPGPSVRLADFGIARLAIRTLRASGSGTLGYMAPEQAMGKPSYRSDVFAMGLLLYRMLTGHLPEYPFTWPPPGVAKLRRKARPELVALVRKALETSPRRRFRDADVMYRAYCQIKRRAFY